MGRLQCYVNFKNTKEAFDFYKEVFNTEEPQYMYYKDMPEEDQEGMGGADPNFIVNAEMKIGESIFRASDAWDEELVMGNAYTITYIADTIEEANKIYDALLVGGESPMPMGETFWSPAFGMVTDKFGVSWMVMVMGEY